MVKVKICGITNLEDALAAVEYGADALGFVFAPSPRRMTAAAVKDIVSTLPPSVCKVGVFVNAELEQVRETMSMCNLDMAQLHGDEDPDCCAALFPKVIKVFTAASLAPPEALARYRVAAFMLDLEKNAGAREAEQRRLWQLAREVGQNHPVILAGGLTPETVQEAIEAARPCAVDVSSGVEARPGKKDREKLRAFIAAAKMAEANSHRVGALSPTRRAAERPPYDAESARRLPRYNTEGECHFVTSVTRDHRQIFRDSDNVAILVKALGFYQRRGDLRLLGYVVMPDHIHLMIVPTGGTVSDVMRNIKAYTGNAIRQRIGTESDVWQDSFYDHLVEDERDFQVRLGYMHENPLRSGIVEDLKAYPYSSYTNFYTDLEPVLEVDVDWADE